MATLTLMPSQEKSVRVCCRREERRRYLGTPAFLGGTSRYPTHREVVLPEAEKDPSVGHSVCVSGKQEDEVCLGLQERLGCSCRIYEGTFPLGLYGMMKVARQLGTWARLL